MTNMKILIKMHYNKYIKNKILIIMNYKCKEYYLYQNNFQMMKQNSQICFYKQNVFIIIAKYILQQKKALKTIKYSIKVKKENMKKLILKYS